MEVFYFYTVQSFITRKSKLSTFCKHDDGNDGSSSTDGLKVLPWLQLGALQRLCRTRCFQSLLLVRLSSGMQFVLDQILAAGAEGVIERGGEASNIIGNVWKDFRRCLVIITDLYESGKKTNLNTSRFV